LHYSSPPLKNEEFESDPAAARPEELHPSRDEAQGLFRLLEMFAGRFTDWSRLWNHWPSR
ncbi:hypothetical protein ACWCSD_51530, partial [Nonomuraea sp. NPDC001684]